MSLVDRITIGAIWAGLLAGLLIFDAIGRGVA